MHGSVMTERHSNFAVTLVAVLATLHLSGLFVCIDILKEATDWNVYSYCAWLSNQPSACASFRDILQLCTEVPCCLIKLQPTLRYIFVANLCAFYSTCSSDSE